MQQLPIGSLFKVERNNETFDESIHCWSMRNGETFSGQEQDWYGLACICHALLFSQYLQIKEGPLEMGWIKPRLKLTQPLKRYWNVNLWNETFDLLLNPERYSQTIDVVEDGLNNLRMKWEEWLVDHCLKNGKSLKSLLRRCELTT